MTRAEALRALLQIGQAIVETVDECGDQGAPAGVLYAALMERGCSHEQFEAIMAGLVGAGRLEKRGHVYYSKRR